MRIILKFFLIVYINFIVLNTYSIEPPGELIVDVLLSNDKKESYKTKNLDLIDVKYSGWIFDSNISTNNYCNAKGKMFDSNVKEKFNHTEPFQFVLGKGIVIKGWDIGLQNMKVNEIRCLVIPPHLAYGNRRIGNIIKPNSTLIFEVKLLKILKVKE
tara:strand:- start:787 stop:1257 length:471 start_codon:yes stop_codon:yes gene_type:complete